MQNLTHIIQNYLGMTPKDKGCDNWFEMMSKMEEEINDFFSGSNKENENNYSIHYTNWRDRYFDAIPKYFPYKSKINDNRFTNQDLEKKYQKAMNQSPFLNK
jgi:hypothetical protein